MRNFINNQTLTQYISICFLLLCFSTYSSAQLNPTPNANANALVANLVGPGIQFNNAVLVSAGTSAGTFNGGNTTNIGIPNGVLLTSGDVNLAPGPNNLPGAGVNNVAAGNPNVPVAFDATSLQFNFIPTGNNLSFNYVFASEEYPEFFCDNFNDAFAFLLTGPMPNGGMYNNTNLATIQNGIPVSINNVGPFACNGINNIASYVDNTNGATIQYDGFTVPLMAQAAVIPCATYTIQLIIGDNGDGTLDSGVFLQQGSFASVNGPNPLYIYEDVDGNPKSEFCEGESVFMDATASTPGTAWFLSIWQYDIGGFAAGDPHLSYCQNVPQWTPGAPGVVPLNPIWANCFGSPDFPAGFEYRVQLAFTDPCGGWFPANDITFTVVPDPIPDYYFTDADGNPKTVFCLGEDVYINGEESMFEDKFHLDIWQYDIGGYAAGASHTGYSRNIPSWSQGEVGMEHLNPTWSNFGGDYFEPGFEYRVKLAVSNDCVGWVTKEDLLFTVRCCDEPETCFAKFTLDSSENDDGTINHTTNNVASNDYPWSTSNWFLFSHDDNGSGPYTPVGSGTGPGFDFTTNIDNGGCFTLVHKVITPCGECCFMREICHNAEEGLFISESIPEIECEFLEDEFCNNVIPSNLDCRTEGSRTVLSWDPVPFAVAYIVTIKVNDPECCEFTEDSQEENGFTMTMPDPFIITSFEDGVCFSWFVQAVCPNGEISEPSEKICQFAPCEGEPDDEEEEDEEVEEDGFIISGSQKDIKKDKLTVYPNPASNIVNFEINTLNVSEQASIKIYSSNYQLIETLTEFTISGNLISGSWNSTKFQNGIYFIEVTLDDNIIAEKILLIK